MENNICYFVFSAAFKPSGDGRTVDWREGHRAKVRCVDDRGEFEAAIIIPASGNDARGRDPRIERQVQFRRREREGKSAIVIDGRGAMSNW